MSARFQYQRPPGCRRTRKNQWLDVRQIVDTILSSTTRLVANRAAWADEWKRRKIEDLALLLQGALDARRKVGVKMNLHKSCLDSVRPHLALPDETTALCSCDLHGAWLA